MLLGALFCLLAGLFLGLRFKVFALIPATAITLLVTFLLAISRGASLGEVAFWIATNITVLQLGYFGGLLGRSFDERKRKYNKR